MNSKEFSELLVFQRNEAGVSVEEMASRMEVTPYVVRDIEIGSYNCDMEKSMLYISCLNLKLVLVWPDMRDPVGFDSYEKLAKWAASRWPKTFAFKYGRLDAYGKQHFHAGEIGSFKSGISREKFLRILGNDVEVQLWNEKQFSECLEQRKITKEKDDKVSKTFAKIVTPIVIVCALLWLFLAIKITLNLPDKMYHDIAMIGAFISFNGWFGVILFPFLIVAICLLIPFIAIVYGIIRLVRYLVEKWYDG